MEATVGSGDGKHTEGGQRQLARRPEGDEEPPRTYKRQRTSGSVGRAARAEDLADAAAPTGGTGGSGAGVVTSPGGASEGVRAEPAAVARPPPCMGAGQEGASSEPQQGPGSPEIIVIHDDEDEEEKDREFEREIALLKAEIASLVALAKELQAQEAENSRRI